MNSFSLLIVILAILTGLSSCKAAPAMRTGSAWAHEASDLAPHPGVVYGRLANGMRYALMQNEAPPDQVSIRFQIAVGSRHEEDNQLGLAHFIEHMAFNGSTNIPEGELVRILERKGLVFGADTNASTGFDNTTYTLNLPTADEAMVDTALLIMRETSSEILFDADAIDRERGVVESEKRSRSSLEAEAAGAQQTFLMPGARTTNRSPIGSDEVLRTVQREEFVDFYDKYYRPERAFLVMVGDFDVSAVKTKIEDVFSTWKPSSNVGIEPDPGYFEERGLVAGVFQDDDIATMVNIVQMDPPTPLKDTVSARQRSLLHAVAVGVVNQRFLARSRQADPDFFNARVGYNVAGETGIANFAAAGASSPSKKWREAVSALEQEIRRAMEHGFSRSEVAAQVALIHSLRENALKSEETRSSASLADGILAAYDNSFVFVHPATELDYLDAFADRITPEAVQAAFLDQWEDGEPLLFVSSSESISPADVVAAYRQSRSTQVTGPKETNDEAFAYSEVGPAGEIVWRDEIEDLGITRARFENNVMVNIKRTAFEKDQVYVMVRIGGGKLSFPMTKYGFSSVAESGLIAGGLKAHSIGALQRLLAGRLVMLNFGIEAEHYSFSGSTVRKDLLLQLQLWTAFIQHAQWREGPLLKMRMGLAQQFAQRGSSVGSVAAWELPGLLHPGDPRWARPSEDELRRLTIADIRSLVDESLSSEAIEIGLVGDVDPEEALAAIARTFGALPQRESAFRPYSEGRVAPKFPDANTTPLELFHRGEAGRALGQVYWPTTDGMDVKTAHTANMLRAVLDLKILEEIREKHGGAYSPRFFLDMSPVYKGYGYLAANLDVEPERLTEFFDIVDAIVAEVVSGNISDDEWTRARAPILEGVARAPESSDYWLGAVARAQSHEEDLEVVRSIEDDIRAITKADIVSFATAYLLPEKAWRVQIVANTK